LEIEMNWEDPIVKEVREIREQLTAEHGNDLRALCKYLQEREQRESRNIVTRKPRRPDASGIAGVQDAGTSYDAE
jgi:bisphosphoglycerate-dependent phosphoglycerate mutase